MTSIIELTPEEIIKRSLGIAWEDTEASARRVAKWACENLCYAVEECPYCDAIEEEGQSHLEGCTYA